MKFNPISLQLFLLIDDRMLQFNCNYFNNIVQIDEKELFAFAVGCVSHQQMNVITAPANNPRFFLQFEVAFYSVGFACFLQNYERAIVKNMLWIAKKWDEIFLKSVLLLLLQRFLCVVQYFKKYDDEVTHIFLEDASYVVVPLCVVLWFSIKMVCLK